MSFRQWKKFDGEKEGRKKEEKTNGWRLVDEGREEERQVEKGNSWREN